jgi:hypothetical protein
MVAHAKRVRAAICLFHCTGYILPISCVLACEACTGHIGPVGCVCAGAARTGRVLPQLARVCDVHTGYTLTISCVRAYGACRSCRAYTGHALPVSSARACGVYTCPDLHASLRAVHQQEALLGNFVAGGSSASPRI